jgi:hypothetical protein
MSPRASCSATSTEVIAERSSKAPPSSPGTPSIVTPSSFACSSSSGGAVQAASASSAAGRSLSSAKSPIASRIICCSSVGVRSKSFARLPVPWRTGPSSFRERVKVRPAAPAARKPLRVAE